MPNVMGEGFLVSLCVIVLVKVGMALDRQCWKAKQNCPLPALSHVSGQLSMDESDTVPLFRF